MSLSQRASNPPESRFGLPCSLATLLTDLPKGEVKALQGMLDAPWRLWSHADIERAIREEGHHVGTGAVGKHRRGECRCNRS